MEATTAPTRPSEAAATLEGLRSCSNIHTYLASTALAVAWMAYDTSATPATSGYAHGPSTSHGHG